jgi:glycosyltransferase involved in cell wall biosynthesis
MRVALFTECYRPIVNGVVVSVVTFSGELAKLGNDVQIFAPAYPGHRDAEANVHRLPSVSLPTRPRYPLALPYSGVLLRRYFAAHPPDIVHAQHPFVTGREARRVARWVGCPLVFTYHTLIRAYAHYVPLPRPLVRTLAVRISRDFANSADVVVVPTRAVGEILRSYGVVRPLEAIPTGVDLDLIRTTSPAPMRPRFGVPEGVPLIAYTGRIAREKSIDTLITALALLPPAHRDAHLLLVGGGPWYRHCRDLARTLGVADRVHFTGYLSRPDVFRCLADSDLFAFASLTDTQGVAVLEAMAHGLPPVAVASGAVADIIRDGVDGLLVDPTPQALADGLARVLDCDSLRQTLAGHALRRAEQFSAGRMAQRLVDLYQRLLNA